MKFHKTLLAVKTPKSSIFIANIGILNAKNKAFKTQKKKHFKCPFLAFKMPKMVSSFYEMDPWYRFLIFSTS